MFGIKEWKQTKFYQETKLEAAPRLLKMGLSVELFFIFSVLIYLTSWIGIAKLVYF